jgi:hypothetical protein
MAVTDEKSFVDFLRLDTSVHILRYRSPGPEPDALAELMAADEPWGCGLWLWNSSISPPPTVHYVPEQNFYYLDPIPNEVIEFHRCQTVNGRITRGRIWAEFNYWNNGNPSDLIRKSNDFEKWFNRLARWIKRQAVYHDSREYFLKDARALMER